MADYEFSQTKLEPADSVQMLAINGTSPGYLTGAELKDFIAGQMPSGVPVGTIVPYGGDSLPNGFLDCNGAAVSRTTYDVLFSIIGTTYGEGDGYSTFNLPNLTGRFLEGGAEAGEYKEAGLPNLRGFADAFSYAALADKGEGHSGGIIKVTQNTAKDQSPGWSSSSLATITLDVDASRGSEIYKDDETTVQPASLVVRFVIKAYDYNADPTPVSEFESQIAALTSQVGALQNRRHIVDTGSEVTSIGYQWYRLWSDGWVEQGGIINKASDAVKTVTFLVPFSSTDYAISKNFEMGTNQATATTNTCCTDISTTSFKTSCNSTYRASWFACGQGATT